MRNADEVAVIVLDNKVVDFVSFDLPQPLYSRNDQIRTRSRHDRVADR